MEIKKISIEKINPAPYNPRKELKPGDWEYEALVKSIDEFDYIDPIIWNKKTGNLVGGHQRFNVLKEKGYTEFDVSVVNLDLIKEKKLNIALNKISGEWDNDKFSELLNEFKIDNKDFDFQSIGVTDIELQEININDNDCIFENDNLLTKQDPRFHHQAFDGIKFECGDFIFNCNKKDELYNQMVKLKEYMQINQKEGIKTIIESLNLNED